VHARASSMKRYAIPTMPIINEDYAQTPLPTP
jgi:hypothetical protein